MQKPSFRSVLTLTVLVASLGYFVDIFDLLLFPIVRESSLRSLGVAPDKLLSTGTLLLNMQMGGMFVGGVVWGILGDKKGRMTVLFGSIIIYSVANILNAYVSTIPQYVILRFIAGFGLAGELGAAITLVGEQLHQSVRGYGTSVVATVGIAGGVVAGFVGNMLTWQQAYILGGVLGLLLLLLRVQVAESAMFTATRTSTKVEHGNFLMLFSSRKRFIKYVHCILIGIPLWYGVGILMTFSPEIAPLLHVQGTVHAGIAIAYCYGGISVGDLAAGFLSQKLQSRKQAIQIFLALAFVMTLLFLVMRGLSVDQFYWICAVFGLTMGYWTLFVTVASEQYGTNLRATVTTTAPNFVRGSVVLLTLSFAYLKGPLGVLNSALFLGILSILIAAISITSLRESFHQDLDFLETD